MDASLVPRREIDFVLHELLGVDRLCERPRFAEHSHDTFAASLDAAYAIAEEKFAPHAREGDAHEPHVRDSRVVLPEHTQEAVRAFADAGFIAAIHDASLGGMQLPLSVAAACWGVFKGANIGFETYAALTAGAANLVAEFGTREQIERYVPPLLEGRWLGTMVLTEPQAGSSLADIQSTATPTGDGRYRLRGQKIFITAGDHELTDNIVHLVLARLPDAPKGTKGLSLFIVPKRREDGSGNDVALAGLIHKLGCRATTSAMLSFGERGDCIGELLGEPNQGLACMFRMMNEARLNVGMCATMLGFAGYGHSLAYARERVQGRDGKGQRTAIVHHADVKRMLLAQKAAVEGSLALCLYAASLADDAATAPRETERAQAQSLLDLLTPVVKAWPSHHCVQANSEAIQVHGGYGYTRDFAVEQVWRDNRLNAIHEGTNGIQSLDLLGRKAVADGGRALELLGQQVMASVDEAHGTGDTDLRAHAQALQDAWSALRATTLQLARAIGHNPQLALANSAVYLDVFGHTVVAWLWLRQAVIARRALKGAPDPDFYKGKLAAARYCFGWMLPPALAQHALLRRLDDTCHGMHEAWF
jgi:butyryl-CoA dehydrogenase